MVNRVNNNDPINEMNSSLDSDSGTKLGDIEPISFYMVDNKDDLSKYSHDALIQKITLLQKIHKRREYKIQQSKIGWNLLFDVFFSKFFLLKFNKSLKKRYLINLKEIEFRIRKEIGRNACLHQNYYKDSKEFSLFCKYDTKPPVSTWYEYNILNDKLIDPSEKDRYVPDIINTILNIRPKEKAHPKIRRVASALSDKRKSLGNQAFISRRKTVTLDLTKFSSNDKTTENTMALLLTSIEKKENKNDKEKDLLNITKKEKLPYGLSKKSPHILKLLAFPKSVVKLLGKFEKKFIQKGYTLQEAEEELTNIQNDQKTYEIELRKNKIYMDNNLYEKKYLYDFRYLNSLFEKQKKEKQQTSEFVLKNELEIVMNDIDRLVEYELKKIK